MWNRRDRVKIVDSVDQETIGIKGKIVYVNYGVMLVEFDEDINGHDGGGMYRRGCCWYFYGYSEDSIYAEQEGIRIKKITNKKNNYY